METVSRRRRNPIPSEPEAVEASRDQEYQTALSQAAGGATAGEMRRGEVSPGTLESGGAAGEGERDNLPVANPFHSERVRTEVELIRSRPSTLDAEAARLGMEVNETALGDLGLQAGEQEPDYSASFAAEEPPRVARVEPSSELDRGLVAGAPVGQPESPSRSGKGRGASIDASRLEEAWPDMVMASGRKPPGDDSRELIPAEGDRIQRMESLLEQVLEENKSLKQRLQTESHSSWHSQLTRTPAEGGVPFSPASFALGHPHAEAFPSFQNAAQFVDPPGSDFPGSFGRFDMGLGMMVDPRFGFMGQQQGPSEGRESSTSGMRDSGGFVPLPPPLPLMGRSSSETVPQAPVPQTLRQFTAEALAGGDPAAGTFGAITGAATPRGSGGVGYPVSPGGTVIRPPPGPPPVSPRVDSDVISGPRNLGLLTGGNGLDTGLFPGSSQVEAGNQARPEEPAKYISELPKLVQADLSNSAVVCGNWLAQIRQIFQGLSPSADVWFASVEGAASRGYSQWLTADPLGRISLDPGAITAMYDTVKFQRVESRAVSLLLAALPQAIKDDVIMNRWLSSSSILFRVMCLYQPGGSSERALLLSQLVQPEVFKNFKEAIAGLRKWQQNLIRAQEIHATLPDASLLLRGVDSATTNLLASNPMVGFRINAFRHRTALDYNPSVGGVVQLVRLVQAESEAVALLEAPEEKRQRTAAVTVPKAPPSSNASSAAPAASSPPSVAAVQPSQGETKGKGKGKEKGGDSSSLPCQKFSDSSGCRFGDSCMFNHDRAKARREGRCLACGQSGHYRPSCPLVTPENRASIADSGSEASPKAPPKGTPKGKAKAKAGAQAKGITEESSRAEASAVNAVSSVVGTSPAPSPASLVAEAAKLLKGVSIRALGVDELDLSWVCSALTSVSDTAYCLVDSGATNALRPADRMELDACRVIKVDLASGTTELRVNDYGTLLHSGACQVIIPAAYLIELGFSISWRRKGCRIKHPTKGLLEVTVVKGCPLIPKEVGLTLLAEYEARLRSEGGLKRIGPLEPERALGSDEARSWLAGRLSCVGEAGLSERDQVTFLAGLFPQVPLEILSKVVVPAVEDTPLDPAQLPWNRRLRRSVSRAPPATVLVNCSEGQPGWKGMGQVLKVTDGLESGMQFRQLLKWAQLGVVGGLILNSDSRISGTGEFGTGVSEFWNLAELEDEDQKVLVKASIRWFRAFLLLAVAQATKDRSLCGFEGEEPLTVSDPDDLPPTGLDSPEELAEWALRRAAVKLSQPGQTRVSDSKGGVCRQPKLRPSGCSIFVAFERPRDPVGRCDSSGQVLGWAPTEVATLVRVYGLNEAVFDQGCLGALEKGTTHLLTSSWLLYESLHALKVSRELDTFLVGLDRLRLLTGDAGRKGWSQGLIRIVRGLWGSWRNKCLRADEISERKALLRKMTEEQSYQAHVQNDHSPYRRGCPVCITSQGRQRSHWRSSFPEVHSASFDIAGPFVPGQSYDVEASGRDLGLNYRYFLACAYAIPEKYKPEGDGLEGCSEYEPSECGVEPVDPIEVGLDSSLDELLSLPEGEATEKAVTHRVRRKRPEDGSPGDGPLREPPPEVSGESSAVKLGKTKTVFLGVPLRSKRGKEVYVQVQGLINKLEAFGLPVHRYHADRAKELRSTALIHWLKGQGIHPSWTAGESPAGNRAELAVQNLKGFVRKLLVISGLDKGFWPLALLHASSRNYRNFAEHLGVPQPVLLPFGVKVHARQRVKTGYDAQWRPRTIQGCYVGEAPSTPGGHLVLIKDGLRDKVLLTNTIYPLRGETLGPPLKPWYRLTTKRSPVDLAVRVVAASEIASGGSRFAPGGESSCGSYGDGVFENGVFENGDSDYNGSEDELVEVGREGGGEFVESDFTVRKGVNDLEPLAFRVVELEAGFEGWLQDKIDNGSFSGDECAEVLSRGFGFLPHARRPMFQQQGRAVMLGLYGVGGFKGITKATSTHAGIARYLNRFVKSQSQDHVWTTLYVTQNTRNVMHRDLRNAHQFPILARAVGSFVGGGLWIESEDGQGPVCRRLPSGEQRVGHVYDIKNDPVVFCGKRWHVAEPWEGEVRWVISAFVPRDFYEPMINHWDVLGELGFPVEGVALKGKSEGREPDIVLETEACAIKGCLGNAEADWEVGLPLPVLDEVAREGWVFWHEGLARLCRLLSAELCGAVESSEEVAETAALLHGAERWCLWLEQWLGAWADSGGFGGTVKALQVEIPLNDQEKPSDQFLQTRTISLQEARKELNLWREPASDEVLSLESTNRAVDRVKSEVVEDWVAQGVTVIQLPGKAVLTRKSGTGKRRCRAVCCGNYMPPERLGLSKDDIYASRAEALTLRVALAFAAIHRTWGGFTIDVKSAFLYAPIGAEGKGKGERIVVKPPSFLVELGILEHNDRWWVRKALYGLPTSPRDWSNYRDKELRETVLEWNGGRYCLFQSKADESLWFLRSVFEGGVGEIAGLLVVYVDDLAFFSPQAFGRAVHCCSSSEVEDV